MQNIVRWRSDQFHPTHIWNSWSNKTDANLENSACRVRVFLIFPIAIACVSWLDQACFDEIYSVLLEEVGLSRSAEVVKLCLRMRTALASCVKCQRLDFKLNLVNFSTRMNCNKVVPFWVFLRKLSLDNWIVGFPKCLENLRSTVKSLMCPGTVTYIWIWIWFLTKNYRSSQ